MSSTTNRGGGFRLNFPNRDELPKPRTQAEETEIVTKAVAYAKAHNIKVDGPEFERVVGMVERGEV